MRLKKSRSPVRVKVCPKLLRDRNSLI